MVTVISQSVCPWQDFTAQSSVKGRTLQLITETVNYGRNKIYDTGPRGLNYKSIIYRNTHLCAVSQSVCQCQPLPTQSNIAGKVGVIHPGRLLPCQHCTKEMVQHCTKLTSLLLWHQPEICCITGQEIKSDVERSNGSYSN